MANDRGMIGIQFHPEVVHTPQGTQIIENFLYRLCGCRGDWTAGNFVADSIERIRTQVGSGRVICALSGGVDSAVAATLVHRAVGDQLTCIFVDNGLMRREEPERVVETFGRHMQMDLVHVDAADRFLTKLAGVIDPEEKRRIVGETFIRVFEAEADKIGAVDFMVQGTTYPDVIESAPGVGAAVKIKSHHNVGGLPKELTFDLVEPLRFLFKDEVRQVGLALGLPDEMVYRQPFPGPGALDPDHRRGDERARRGAAGGRLDRHGRSEEGGSVLRALAVVRRAHRHPLGRRHGRLPHLRSRRRAARGERRGRDDGGLGAPSIRRAGADEQPDRERSAGREPRRLRHHIEATGDDRVGVTCRRAAHAGCRATGVRKVECG